MELNAGVTSNANDSGFLIERGSTGDNAIFMWDESADKFTLGTTTATGTTTGDITLSSTGTLVANVEGDVTGAVTGNADTATTLATARNFSLTGDVTAGAVSFDGSGNVALSTTIAANSVALGTDTTGNYMSDLTEGTGIDITHTPAEGSNGTIALDLTEVGFGGGANRLITDDGDGTVSTESNLTFDGSTLDLDGILQIDTTDALGYLKLDVSGTNKAIVGLEPAVGGGSADDLSIYSRTGNLRFWANGGQKAIIDTSGNVGIGTDSPDYELDVAGDIGVDHLITHNSDSNTYVQFTNDRLRFAAGGEVLLDLFEGTQDYVLIGDGGDVDINLNGDMFVRGSDGNVGIGTDAPSAYLHTEGASNGTESYAKFSTGSAAGDQILTIKSSSSRNHMALQVNTGAGATDDLALNPDGGNVGIGTDSPATTLEVDGILTMEDVAAPAEGVAGHAQMFSNGGEMKVNDASGTITTISPHNFELIPEGASEDMAWSHHSVRGNKKVNVDMMKLARLVEELTGEKLVYTEED
jgi:hypothetical protein